MFGDTDLATAEVNFIEDWDRLSLIPGAAVWGARTLRPSSEWRYIPVRRTAMFLRKRIFNEIQWAVFEPNDDELWASLRSQGHASRARRDPALTRQGPVLIGVRADTPSG